MVTSGLHHDNVLDIVMYYKLYCLFHFRYILILHPVIYPRIYTTRNVWLMIITVWVLSFSLMLLPLLEIWGSLGWNSETFSCTILSKNGKSPKEIFFLVGFFVPFFAIVFSYSRIYWHVRKIRQNLQNNSNTKLTVQRFDNFRMTKMMFITFLGFLICYLPLLLVHLCDVESMPVLRMIASVLVWSSSVINPLIYAGANKLYRQAYRQVLCLEKRV